MLSAEAKVKTGKPEKNGMDPAKLSQVDAAINKAIQEETIPGAVISVVRDNRIVYLKAYGNKSIVPDVAPMTTNTIFDLASVSKCMGTTLSFMQLLENGSVKLTDRVDKYIPDFKPWVDPETGETVYITIQDLMTHTSGLSAYFNANSYCNEYGENTPDQCEHYIATQIKRNFRPKTDYIYSCLNFITLQRVLERVTGEKLYQYAHDNIYKPMRLKNTLYYPLHDKPANKKAEKLKAMVAPTEVQPDGKPLLAEVHDPIARRAMDGNSGNAGLFSNAEDLSALCVAIMNGGGKIMKPETVRLMTTIPADNNPEVERALGWGTDGPSTITHTGYTGTSVTIDMDTKTAIVLLTNRVHPTDEGSLASLRKEVKDIVSGSITE